MSTVFFDPDDWEHFGIERGEEIQELGERFITHCRFYYAFLAREFPEFYLEEMNVRIIVDNVPMEFTISW